MTEIVQAILSALGFSILNWPEVLLRIGLAILFGYIIGFDRYSKNKPIDFRVYMIVSVSTCIIAMMGQELYGDYSEVDNLLRIDLAKIIEVTLTGIGFLGAGAIMKESQSKMIGAATGASIWASGGIGLCLGFGFYGLAIVGFVSVAVILIVFGYFTSEDNQIRRIHEIQF